MKRHIEAKFSNGYCGCEVTEYETFEEGTTDEEITAYFEEMLPDYMETYEYVATGWGQDFESEEERDWYYQNGEVSWEETFDEDDEEEEE